ncbi:hypothetical protein CUB90_12805 [Clostridium sp. CT7]|nr:hypothetical protein CUB90_12805 [Clostridium sp. CT7]
MQEEKKLDQVNDEPDNDKLINDEPSNNDALMECESDLVKFKIRDGFIPVRMPVIITEVTVNINIENVVDLEEPILCIDSVSKEVKLGNCKLIPETNMLFLNGTVIKSIQYCEQRSNSNLFDGKVKNIIVNVPFRCVTKVKYIVKPVFYGSNKSLRIINVNDERTFIDSYREEEKICCELMHVKFEELNEKGQKIKSSQNHKMEAPKRLRQSMVMHVTIRLIQNQTLFILKGR